ncbi:MAG: molybdate ABC transporter substrate-binding protein [Dehalococcoidales bacterium]|nr:molybdate ABC transporter substrate-binding protein [Dehalococcoidales bacterium]
MKFINKYYFITLCLVALMVMVTTLSGCSASTPVDITVSAAGSLTDVITEINTLYMEKNSNVTITANFASSGTLQQQIEQGAPVDVFFSAAAKQMDNLQNGDLILVDTRQNVVTNSIVLVVPLDSTLNITSFEDLTTDKVQKVAYGDPSFVPAGNYAKQVFDFLGITTQVEAKKIIGSDVRQVLTYVETGEVDAGLVFATDALISAGVKVVASAPAEINAKIIYPVAIIKASTNVEAAQAYIDFLFTDEAKAIFEKYGFSMVVS